MFLEVIHISCILHIAIFSAAGILLQAVWNNLSCAKITSQFSLIISNKYFDLSFNKLSKNFLIILDMPYNSYHSRHPSLLTICE